MSDVRKPQQIDAKASSVRKLYGQEYDFPMFSSQTPALEYMLASVPRSGSTYLAMEMWRTGVMGAPMEYLNPPFANIMRRRLGSNGRKLQDYFRTIRLFRTSPNGVFGYKMFISDYMLWARKYPDLLPLAAPGKVVFLKRLDLIEQAVSYSKAIRSGAWFHDVRGGIHPEYDAEHIRRCFAKLQYQIDFWRRLFELTGTRVYHVRYEDLVNDCYRVIEGIADFLGVRLEPGATVALPRTQVQRGAESAEWVMRFKSDYTEGSAPVDSARSRRRQRRN